MDIALVIVVLLLAATVVTLVLRLSRDSVAVPVPEIKVDTTSLVTAVKEAVDAQVQSSARGALEHNAKQADALLGQRGETLKEETKNLLKNIILLKANGKGQEDRKLHCGWTSIGKLPLEKQTKSEETQES